MTEDQHLNSSDLELEASFCSSMFHGALDMHTVRASIHGVSLSHDLIFSVPLPVFHQAYISNLSFLGFHHFRLNYFDSLHFQW